MVKIPEVNSVDLGEPSVAPPVPSIHIPSASEPPQEDNQQSLRVDEQFKEGIETPHNPAWFDPPPLDASPENIPSESPEPPGAYIDLESSSAPTNSAPGGTDLLSEDYTNLPISQTKRRAQDSTRQP